MKCANINALHIRKNSRPYQILKYLTIGSGVLLLSLISPMGGAQLIKAGINSYIREKRFEKEKFLRDLKNLQKRELIDYQELENGKIEIKITKDGKNKMLQYQVDDMKLKKPQKWDRKWRLIMFDIPHSHRMTRDVFRRKLINLEFYPLQKSVFITPLPCEDEIDFIASIYEIRKHILILYVSNFEGEEKLKHYFKI